MYSKKSIKLKSDLLVFNIILSLILLFFIIIGFKLIINHNLTGGLIILIIFSSFLMLIIRNIYSIKIILIDTNEIIVYSFWSKKEISNLELKRIDRIVIKFKSDVKWTTKYLKINCSDVNFKINIVGALISDILPYFENYNFDVFEEMGDGSLRLIKK